VSRPRDLLKALLADLEQIEDNAQLYRSGRESAYQAVAIQSRNLLLSGRHGGCLVESYLVQCSMDSDHLTSLLKLWTSST
jgi:hypothetical protein